MESGTIFAAESDADEIFTLLPELEYMNLELPDNSDLDLDLDKIQKAHRDESFDEELFESPRNLAEYWSMYGIQESTRQNFQDGIPWSNQETGHLLKFQYLLREVPLEWLESWAAPEDKLSGFADLPAAERNAMRFDAFRIYGTFRQAKKVTYPPEIARRFSMPDYWIVSVEMADGSEVIIFCTKIPRVLQNAGAARVRVAANTILMKAGETTPFPRIYFLADRLEYYPDNFLGNRKMDFGLFDDLDREPLDPKEVRSKPQDLRLSSRNRECFYRLMNCVSKISPEEMKTFWKETLRTSPPERLTEDRKASNARLLYERPRDEYGNFFYLRGTAKEVIPIRVEDKDVTSRFGITHYYQISMFTLESADNPIIVLTTKLPKGMKPGKDAGYREDIVVPAFFFNLWGFPSVDAEGKAVTRLTPLFMGGTPVLLPPNAPMRAFWVEMILMIVLMTGLLSISIYLLFMERREKQLRKEFLKREELPEGEVFDETKINTEGYMDFTTWVSSKKMDND